MRKYKIREEKFEDNTSKFIPIFGDKSQIDNEYSFHDFFDAKADYPKSLIFNSYEDALKEIQKDKKRQMSPIEIIIHDIVIKEIDEEKQELFVDIIKRLEKKTNKEKYPDSIFFFEDGDIYFEYNSIRIV